MSLTAEKLTKKSAPVEAPEVPSDPWAGLLETSTLVPAFTRGPVVDVDRDIPGSLRALFEVSYAEYAQEIKLADGTTLPANSTKYREQDFGTQERAKTFIDFARKYAKYRRIEGEAHDGQISARAFQNKDGDKLTTVVRFAFLPLVKHDTQRLPGSTSDDAALIRDWAKQNGIEIPSRGRIPKELRDKYNAFRETMKTDA